MSILHRRILLSQNRLGLRPEKDSTLDPNITDFVGVLQRNFPRYGCYSTEVWRKLTITAATCIYTWYNFPNTTLTEWWFINKIKLQFALTCKNLTQRRLGDRSTWKYEDCLQQRIPLKTNHDAWFDKRMMWGRPALKLKWMHLRERWIRWHDGADKNSVVWTPIENGWGTSWLKLIQKIHSGGIFISFSKKQRTYHVG